MKNINSILTTFIVLFIMLQLSKSSQLTPQHVQQHIKRLISQKYQLYVISLGKTINNNQLKAYIITGNQCINMNLGIKSQNQQLSSLSKYPATLITSYMHPREPFSTKLIEKVLDEVLNNYFTDYYFKYMLDNSLLILFPFVNIDGYYRYIKLKEQKASQEILQKYRKNMNKYGKCRDQWDYGVDINRNFDSAFGSLRTSDLQCSQQYRGPQPFSQKQSKAIKTLYKKFKITLAIDIHSYGDQWIYPYASQRNDQKLKNNALYPIYQDLFQQFNLMKRPMKSCFQSLGYTADGVYIDWALDQGALSFAIQIGKSFNNDRDIGSQILFQVQQAFHKILRKNSISYKLFSGSNNQLVIQSTSLIDFQIQLIEVNREPQTVLLQANKKVVVSVDKQVDRITLKVKNTIIEDQVIISQLKRLQESPIATQKSKDNIFGIIKIIVGLAMVAGLLVLGILTYIKKLEEDQQRKKKFSLPKLSELQQQTVDQKASIKNQETNKILQSED